MLFGTQTLDMRALRYSKCYLRCEQGGRVLAPLNTYCYYILFTFSWPRFESGSLRNDGILILRIYFAVDGMPIEMYGESWIAGLLTSDDVMLYMAGFKTTQGI